MRATEVSVEDEIWHHKHGKIWKLVRDLTHENRALRYQNKTLQVRLRRS